MTREAVHPFERDLFDEADSQPSSLCDRLAAFLKAHPNEWIDGRQLATVAGAYGWRTRVSDLRHSPHYLNIINRQRRVGGYTVSEYMLVADVGGDLDGAA